MIRRLIRWEETTTHESSSYHSWRYPGGIEWESREEGLSPPRVNLILGKSPEVRKPP